MVLIVASNLGNGNRLGLVVISERFDEKGRKRHCLFPARLTVADKKGTPVSRDPAAVAAKYSDPLVFTGPIRVRTGYEILRITAFLQQNLVRVNVPFMVLHGTADTVTDPAASRQLHEEARSADKSIKLYDGLLHDLLFEPEGEDIAEDIVGWISARAATAGQEGSSSP